MGEDDRVEDGNEGSVGCFIRATRPCALGLSAAGSASAYMRRQCRQALTEYGEQHA